MGGDPKTTEFLAGVVGVVEASSFERHMLWSENQRRARPKAWKERPSGFLVTVGHLADMPVCISLLTAEVEGHKLLFFDATSQVVDHRLIDEWLKVTLPKTAFRPDGYVNRTDATNFHNVFPPAPSPQQDKANG